jgi:hypothetical protein
MLFAKCMTKQNQWRRTVTERCQRHPVEKLGASYE